MLDWQARVRTDDAIAGLDRLEARIKDSVLLSGVAAMARVIYDEVKLNVAPRTASGNRRESETKGGPPRAPGTLEGAIYRVYAKEDSTDEQKIYKVSVNKSKAPHWHLIEFGTVRSPAYPFIRPAFDHVNRAIDAGNDRMRERLAGGGNESVFSLAESEAALNADPA